jgi:hypothetical protein
MISSVSFGKVSDNTLLSRKLHRIMEICNESLHNNRWASVPLIVIGSMHLLLPEGWSYTNEIRHAYKAWLGKTSNPEKTWEICAGKIG